jgi:hypothetical protein
MKITIRIIILATVLILLMGEKVPAQGITKSTGLGFRGGIWTYKEFPHSEIAPGSVVTSPFSASIYFFSRLSGNWYLEGSIGGVSDAKIGIGVVETVSLIPLLFAVRYDLLSPKHASAFQPYIAFGLGHYWAVHSYVGGGSVVTRTDPKVGAFLGGGINVVVQSWLAFNSDIKFHLVNFDDTAAENYNGMAFNIGFSIMWGLEREIFRVEEIRVVVKDIYPAYYQFYNTYPLALVTIKNTVSYPIEINVHSNVQGYSERSRESGFKTINPGETKDIQVFALFGPRLLSATHREPAVIDLKVEARAGATITKTLSANVVIHSRNAWNGEMDRLGFFLTPDDEQVMRVSRDITNPIKNGTAQKFYRAKAIFNELKKMGIRYHSDPNIPFYKDDYVQFAAETVTKGMGDCDDLVVLYASFMESVGINTAFVEVRDPEKEMAHLYLMFDTGLSPQEGHLITSNEKRYIVRESTAGRTTVWIPVETTFIDAGFDQAWNAGAMAYLQEGVLRSGITQGWVRIIDVD